MSSDGSDSSPLDGSKAPDINVTLPTPENPGPQSDEDEEPPQLSSEQLLRRASFKKILEDLSSSADALNKPQSPYGTVTPSAQVSVLQGLAANPALLPLLQNLQQSALASAVASQAATAPPPPPPPPPPPTDFTQQLAAAAMMLPGAAQFNAQQHLTAALLHSQQQQQQHASQSPLIANAASVAGHNNLQLPANLLSSALLNASSNPLTNFSAQLASTGGSSMNSLNKPSFRTVSSPDNSPLGGGGGGGEDGTKKREVRLMKNREAARECRRKKKEYIRCLENRVAVLESQNQALIGELRALKELYLPKNQE